MWWFLRQFSAGEVLAIMAGLALVIGLGMSEVPAPAPRVVAEEPARRPDPTPAGTAPASGGFAPVVYGAESHAVMIAPGTRLTASQQEALRDRFEGQPYWGAFAAAPSGAWGASWGHASATAARDGAMVRCRARAEGCVVVALALPAELTPEAVDPAARTLSSRQAGRWREVAEGDGFGPRAYAFSEDGASASGYGADIAAAEREAMALCNSRRQQFDDLPDWPCRIVVSIDEPRP